MSVDGLGLPKDQKGPPIPIGTLDFTTQVGAFLKHSAVTPPYALTNPPVPSLIPPKYLIITRDMAKSIQLQNVLACQLGKENKGGSFIRDGPSNGDEFAFLDFFLEGDSLSESVVKAPPPELEEELETIESLLFQELR
ncbi:hypothetical protein CASFOL_037780 [Castilleja foliolosa]|uniref:Uncharacterized protein n=1 Tax=Castilleja foliolosa TaxID=1961234 RepID=A0ABD3BJL7_9LAMI